MRTIAGRYALEARIGSGGMGTVWRATDLQLQRSVAIKLLHEGLASDSAFAERFRREARAAAKLTHSNVVTVYDTGTDEEGAPFIVMEYVEGASLQHVLHQQGPLPVEDAARVARAVLGALAHAHDRGLVHRDIKPANILSHEGTWKVADFGIAKGLDDTAGLTRSGLIGTAAYLSPEQVSGHQATPASDLYAVGCLLYACLAGESPFGGGAPVAVAMRHLRDPVPPLSGRRPDLPPSFESAIMRALEKNPARRFSSAAEMDAAIAEGGLHGQPSSQVTIVAAAPTAPMQGPGATEIIPATRRPRRTGRRAVVAAFLAAVALAAAATIFFQDTDPTDGAQTPEQTPAPLPTLDPVPTEEPTPTPTEVTPATPRAPATPRQLDLPGLRAPIPMFDATPPPQDPEPTPTPGPDDEQESP